MNAGSRKHALMKGPVWVIRVGSSFSAFGAIADMNSYRKVAIGHERTPADPTWCPRSCHVGSCANDQ